MSVIKNALFITVTLKCITGDYTVNSTILLKKVLKYKTQKNERKSYLITKSCL